MLRKPQKATWIAASACILLGVGHAEWSASAILPEQHRQEKQAAYTSINESITMSEPENSDQRLVEYTLWLTIFTGVLAVSTIGLWLVAWRSGINQSNDMKASVAVGKAANDLNREMSIAARRAWISIEDVKLEPPTTFAEDGIGFSVRVMIKNFGQTPATSVWIGLESYFAENNSEKFVDAEGRFKAQLRAHPVRLGDLLFPADTLGQGEHWVDGIEKIRDAIRTHPSGERKVDFIMFIGVSYRVVGDSGTHITYHAHAMNNVPIGTTIRPGQLESIPRLPFLAGEAN